MRNVMPVPARPTLRHTTSGNPSRSSIRARAAVASKTTPIPNGRKVTRLSRFWSKMPWPPIVTYRSSQPTIATAPTIIKKT